MTSPFRVAVGHDMASQLGEFFGFAQARGKGMLAASDCCTASGSSFHQRRGKQAGRHGAHADGVLRQVARHGQRHAGQARLGGAVGLLAHLAVERPRRRR